jgi:hypothetical protein
MYAIHVLSQICPTGKHAPKHKSLSPRAVSPHASRHVPSEKKMQKRTHSPSGSSFGKNATDRQSRPAIAGRHRSHKSFIPLCIKYLVAVKVATPALPVRLC